MLEAGLGFAVKTDKPDFHRARRGVAQSDEGLDHRMVQFKLTDPEPLLVSQ